MNAPVSRRAFDRIRAFGMLPIRFVSSSRRTGLVALSVFIGMSGSSVASADSQADAPSAHVLRLLSGPGQADANAHILNEWAKALPPHSTVSMVEAWTMFGGQVSRVAIETPARVSVVAKALTQARPWVSHLNVVAGEVLLSGQQDGVSWLASLAAAKSNGLGAEGPRSPPGAASTRGYLSVWTPRSPHPNEVGVAPLLDALRMPPAAQLIFDIDDVDSMYAAALQVWRAPAAWKDPCADMATSLRRTGWRREVAAAATMTSWRRDREVATVHCRLDGRDTLIYMHRSKERT
jgi:hypothetical protein